MCGGGWVSSGWGREDRDAQHQHRVMQIKTDRFKMCGGNLQCLCSTFLGKWLRVGGVPAPGITTISALVAKIPRSQPGETAHGRPEPSR